MVTKPKAVQHRLLTTKLLSKAPKLVSKIAFNNCDVHARQPKVERYRSNAFCLGIFTHNRTLAKTFKLSRIPKVKINRTIKKQLEQLGKRKNVIT